MRRTRSSFAALALLSLLACGDGSPTVPGLDCPDARQADPDCPPTFGAVEGRVLDALSGEPIVGALVATSPATATALTDAQGRFEIDRIDLAEGDVALAVTATRSGYQSDSRVVILREGAARVAVELHLLPPLIREGPGVGASLVVRVTHRDAAFAGATVEVLDVTGAVAEASTSDANGFALFPDLEAGTYTVRARSTIAGRPFADTEGVQLNAGADAFVELDLRQVF